MHLTTEQREVFYREHIPWKLAALTSYSHFVRAYMLVRTQITDKSDTSLDACAKQGACS